MKIIERQRLLGSIQDAEERIAISRVLDKVEMVMETSEPQISDFLNPSQMEITVAILKQIPGISFIRDGGYKEAERQRVIISTDLYPRELLAPSLAVLQMTPIGKGGKLTHNDYLGAIMGVGIRREKIGDIILIADGCQVIVAEEIKKFFTNSPVQAGGIPLSISEIDIEALNVEPTRVKEIQSTVASLRLDSVAGEGFSASRSKMAREIKAERVKVNWKTVSDPAYLVKVNDVISIRGRGRVIVESVLGETRKGRLRIKLKRLMS